MQTRSENVYTGVTLEVSDIDPDQWAELTRNLLWMFRDFKEESRMSSRPDAMNISWISDMLAGKPTGRPERIHYMECENGDAVAFAMTKPHEAGTYIEFIYGAVGHPGKLLLEHIEEFSKAEGKTHVYLCSLFSALPVYLSLGYSPRKPSGKRGWNATLTITSWPLRVAESAAAKQKTRRQTTMRAMVDEEDSCIVVSKGRKLMGRLPQKRLKYRVKVKTHA
jgi:hypothetical protein